MVESGIAAPLLEMPPLSGGHHLVDWLHQAGTVNSGAMGGFSALAWTELRAWSQLCGIELQPWEAETIMLLSRTYASMFAEAADPHCPAPYTPEVIEAEAVEAVGDKIKAGFKALAAQRKR